MARTTLALLSIGLAAVLAGCGPGRAGAWQPPGTAPPTVPSTVPNSTEPPGTPAATTIPSGTTTPSSAIDRVLRVDGIGPYAIGSTLDDLRGRGLLTNVVASPHCDDAFGAESAGGYSGLLTFTFMAGKLTAIHTTSTTLHTPSGGRVGQTLSQLQGIYGSRGTVLTGGTGAKAYIVHIPTGGLAALFLLDNADHAAAISVGRATPLEDAVRNGEGC